MKRSMTLALSLVVLAAAGLPAWAKSPKDEWLSGDMLKQCLEVAAAKDVPVAVIYQFADSSCPLHNARVGTYETLQDLKGMLKVRVDGTVKADDFNDLRRGAFSYMLPVLYLTDGEGNLIGYAAYETPFTDLRDTAKQAAAVMAWKKKTKAALVAIEKQIEAKQLIPARKQAELIAQQDLTATVAVKKSIDKASALARATFNERNKVKPEDAAKEAAAELAPAEGIFFAKQTAELRGKVDALLTEKLTEIEATLTGGDPRKATRDLAPLLKVSFGADGDAKVKALDEKIKAALKEAGGGKKSSGESSADEPAN